MTQRRFRYFEDFSVGEVIDLGEFAPLEQDEIIAFTQRWGHEPAFTDPENADVPIDGRPTAAGMHVVLIAVRLMVDGVLSLSAAEGSPGVDEIQFVRPVRAGDRLSGRLTVLAAEPSKSRPDIGKLGIQIELRNQRHETVLLMAATQFHRRRPDAESDPPA